MQPEMVWPLWDLSPIVWSCCNGDTWRHSSWCKKGGSVTMCGPDTRPQMWSSRSLSPSGRATGATAEGKTGLGASAGHLCWQRFFYLFFFPGCPWDVTCHHFWEQVDFKVSLKLCPATAPIVHHPECIWINENAAFFRAVFAPLGSSVWRCL